MKDEYKKLKSKDDVYFHVGNGGVTFSVNGHHWSKGDKSPSIDIDGGFFGHDLLSLKLHTSHEDIRYLGEYFIKKADEWKKKQTGLYCEPALIDEITEKRKHDTSVSLKELSMIDDENEEIQLKPIPDNSEE